MTAADLILKKALVGSQIGSEQWSYIHAGLRDRAFILSRIEDTRIQSEMRRLTSEVTRMNLDPSEFRREIRKRLQELGYAPKEGDAGTIKDLYSKRRLDVIWRQNRDQARGYIQFKQFTTPTALEEFPANRLVRVQRRKQPRDWDAKWREGAERVGWKGVYRGPDKVALKTSPIWVAINRFGHYYPPFDFGSGMGVENVSIDECIRMKFIKPDDPPQKVPDVGFNDGYECEVPELRNDSLCGQILKRDFGDQIVIENSKVKWQGNLIQDVREGRLQKAKLGIAQEEMLEKMKGVIPEGDIAIYRTMNPSFNRNVFQDHAIKHYGKNEKRLATNIPLDPGDYELMPTVWRSPTKVYPVKDHHAVLELEMLNGSYLQLAINTIRGFASFYKTKMPLGATPGNAPFVP